MQREVEGIGSSASANWRRRPEFLTAAAAGGLTQRHLRLALGLLHRAALLGAWPTPVSEGGWRLAPGESDSGSGFRLALRRPRAAAMARAPIPSATTLPTPTSPSPAAASLIGELVIGTAAPARGQPRPWVIWLGAWRHSGGFDDQRGDPALFFESRPTSIIAYRRRGSTAPTPWRRRRSGARARPASPPARASPPRRRGATCSPSTGDAGLALRGPFGRAADTASLGLAYARAGGEGRAQDRALARSLSGTRGGGGSDHPARRLALPPSLPPSAEVDQPSQRRPPGRPRAGRAAAGCGR